MTSMVNTFYTLLPRQKIQTQEFWNEHIGIIQNTPDGYPYHLGSFSALLMERLFFFRQDASRNNGMLLLLVAAPAWQLIRTLAGITGDERTWFRQQHAQFEDKIFYHNWAETVAFLERMHVIFDIHSFIRHPSNKLMDYAWLFHTQWPEDKNNLIIEAAKDLHSIMSTACNEFAIVSGWENEWSEKKARHDAAMQEAA